MVVRRRSGAPDSDAVPFAGQCVVPGGHISPADRAGCDSGKRRVVARRAAARRLEEETGIALSPDNLRYPWELDNATLTGRRFHIFYFEAWLPPGKTARPDDAELDECRWVRPAVAHAEGRAGRLDIPPATLETLRRLCGAHPSDSS